MLLKGKLALAIALASQHQLQDLSNMQQHFGNMRLLLIKASKLDLGTAWTIWKNGGMYSKTCPRGLQGGRAHR